MLVGRPRQVKSQSVLVGRNAHVGETLRTLEISQDCSSSPPSVIASYRAIMEVIGSSIHVFAPLMN